jgi:hypothetical protein
MKEFYYLVPISDNGSQTLAHPIEFFLIVDNLNYTKLNYQMILEIFSSFFNDINQVNLDDILVSTREKTEETLGAYFTKLCFIPLENFKTNFQIVELLSNISDYSEAITVFETLIKSQSVLTLDIWKDDKINI